MAVVESLSKAFYWSIKYFLSDNSDLILDIGDRVYLDFPLFKYNKPLPYVLITDYIILGSPDSQPYQGASSELLRFEFVLSVHCSTHTEQTWLPEKVKRIILSEQVTDGDETIDGIQIYKGFTPQGDADANSELYAAELNMGNIIPLGGEVISDVQRRYRSNMTVWSDVVKDKTKIFLTANS